MSTNSKKRSSIAGINDMAMRLIHMGGFPQQDRMIKDKRWSLDHAVKYSYQAAKIKKLDKEQRAPALMNPNKLTQNYDDKIVSVGFEYGFQPGDVFEWCNTGTKWLIYLQNLEELAYFRADVRRCRYQTLIRDEDGELHTIYLAVRGPVETKINYIQKSGISVDNPNYSLNILMPKNEYTLKYFQRYAKFYLGGADGETDYTVCWRVEATDTISMPGVLALSAVEYYTNEFEDDVDNGIVKDLVLKPVEPAIPHNFIEGDIFIKPQQEYTYHFCGRTSEWYIDPKYPVEYTTDGHYITLQWTKAYGGQFEIKNGEHTKTVVVESLF